MIFGDEISCKKFQACLNYRVFPKSRPFSGQILFCFDIIFFLNWLPWLILSAFSLKKNYLRFLSLLKAIIFGKIMIFWFTQGPSGRPQAIRYFFYSKPMQKSFLYSSGVYIFLFDPPKIWPNYMFGEKNDWKGRKKKGECIFLPQ